MRDWTYAQAAKPTSIGSTPPLATCAEAAVVERHAILTPFWSAPLGLDILSGLRLTEAGLSEERAYAQTPQLRIPTHPVSRSGVSDHPEMTP